MPRTNNRKWWLAAIAAPGLILTALPYGCGNDPTGGMAPSGSGAGGVGGEGGAPAGGGNVGGDAQPCPQGQTECDNGCIDTDVDSSNCGSCGEVCDAGLVCAGENASAGTFGTCSPP